VQKNRFSMGGIHTPCGVINNVVNLNQIISTENNGQLKTWSIPYTKIQLELSTLHIKTNHKTWWTYILFLAEPFRLWSCLASLYCLSASCIISFLASIFPFRFSIDFACVLGTARWWLHRIATARFARLYASIWIGKRMYINTTDFILCHMQFSLKFTSLFAISNNNHAANLFSIIWHFILHTNPLLMDVIHPTKIVHKEQSMALQVH